MFAARVSNSYMPNCRELLCHIHIRLMCFNVQLDACAELCGISHQTAWEWRHRVMATVDGYQDRIVLGGQGVDRRDVRH